MRQRLNDVEDPNARNMTQKSTFSNNLFHLQKKEISERNIQASHGFESNAAKQDVNESFNTAKEDEEDASNALKKDASMVGQRNDLDGANMHRT